MDIRFISTLTADDENEFAPVLLSAISALLDRLPIAYTVRIETTGAQVFQHSHPACDAAYQPDPPSSTVSLPPRVPAAAE